MVAYDDPFLDSLEFDVDSGDTATTDARIASAPSVYLWGESRPVVNLVLYGMAARLDPEFTWLQVTDRGETDELDMLLRGRWNHPRVDAVDLHATDLLPPPEGHAATVESLLRDDEDVEVDRLREFVGLPESVQRIVSRHLPAIGPKVIAIPNADRLADLYAGRATQLTEILHALSGASVSLLVARADGPGPLRDEFDYVFEVQAPGLRHWADGRLVVEHAPEASSSALGRRLRLDRLPWAVEVLGRVPLAPDGKVRRDPHFG